MAEFSRQPSREEEEFWDAQFRDPARPRRARRDHAAASASGAAAGARFGVDAEPRDRATRRSPARLAPRRPLRRGRAHRRGAGRRRDLVPHRDRRCERGRVGLGARRGEHHRTEHHARPTRPRRLRRKGASATIAVHVAGAVQHPGVVELRTGARVIDAVEAVGGALADGDLDRLNLAAKVTDGQRVYVAKVGQSDPGAAGDGAARPVSTIPRAGHDRRQGQPQHREPGAARRAAGDRTHLRRGDRRRAATTWWVHVGQRPAQRARHRRQALRRARAARHRLNRRDPGAGAAGRTDRRPRRADRRDPGRRGRRDPRRRTWCWSQGSARSSLAVLRADAGVAYRRSSRIAVALLGAGVMQRALHGLVVSPLASAIAHHADATGGRDARRRSRCRSLRHARARARRLVRRTPRRRATRARERLGRHRRAPADPLGRRIRGAAGMVHRVGGLRRALAVEARGGGGARHRDRRRRARPRAPRPSRQRVARAGAGRVDPSAARRPRAARRLPARRHARGAADAHRAVPRRRAHAPHRGLRRERGVRAGAVRAAAPTVGAARPGRGRVRGARVLRHHDPLGAVGAAGDHDGRGRDDGGCARATDHRRAGAGPRRDRAAARRPVPAPPGRVPAVLRCQPRHRAARASDHRASARPVVDARGARRHCRGAGRAWRRC